QLIEVKGNITGSARRTDGGTLVVRSSVTDLEYLMEVGTGIPESLLDVGQQVRVLGKITPLPGSSQTEIRVMAVVKEDDALKVDEARARAAAEREAAEARKRQAQQGGPRLASRGVHNGVVRRTVPTGPAMAPFEVLERYRAAVLYFNKRLSA